MRGSKSGRGGRGGYTHVFKNKPFPFDTTMCPEIFVPVKDNSHHDTTLTQEVLNASIQFSPTDSERADLTAFLTDVKKTLETVRATTDADYLPGVVLDEVHEVGSYVKDTMLRGHRTADLVVVLKSMPTVEAVASLGQKLCSELTGENGVVSAVSRDYGLLMSRKEDKVRILISTVLANVAALEKDLHLTSETINANNAAIYHARCFFEFGNHKVIRALVRTLKAVRSRFPDLVHIDIWALESLAQYALITTTSGSNLSIGPAFRRVIGLLAAGIFIPGASGLTDPVDPRYRLCDNLTNEQMDKACMTAQTLLRILAQGGVNIVLGMADKTPDITKEVTYVGSVVVAPIDRAVEADEDSSPASDDAEMTVID